MSRNPVLAMKRAVERTNLDDLGFRSSVGSVHLSRTVMLGELSLVLDGVSPDAPGPAHLKSSVFQLEAVLGE